MAEEEVRLVEYVLLVVNFSFYDGYVFLLGWALDACVIIKMSMIKGGLMNKRTARTVSKRQDKAAELMELYKSLGFNADLMQGVQIPGAQENLAPVSFLPHVDYTISSVVGA